MVCRAQRIFFEKSWCGDPHTTAAPPVAVFMVFGGRDTFHVSNVVNRKKQTTEGVLSFSFSFRFVGKGLTGREIDSKAVVKSSLTYSQSII